VRRDTAEELNQITIGCTAMLAGPIYAEYPDLVPPRLREQD
jgi:hypothetical protein